VKIRGRIAMDKYDPNRDLQIQPGNCDPPAPRPKDPLSASNFYRELVQFAVFVAVILFPTYIFFSDMTEELRSFLGSYINPIKNENGLIVHHIVDKTFARWAVVVIFVTGFALIFFIRHSMKLHERTPLPAPPNGDIMYETMLEQKDDQINRLRSRISKDMSILKTIHNQVYDDAKPRLNYASTKGTYRVRENGDLLVSKHIILQADDKEGPFWTFYASGDKSSSPVESVDDLKISVLADDAQTDLLFITLEDEPWKKKIAVYFLPQLKPNETRGFRLYYEWPGSFAKLIETGTTNYDWQNRASSSDSIGDFYAEWIFDKNLGEVLCQNTGSKPTGLQLSRAGEQYPCRWIFQGRGIPLGNTPLELTFSTGNDKTRRE